MILSAFVLVGHEEHIFLSLIKTKQISICLAELVDFCTTAYICYLSLQTYLEHWQQDIMLMYGLLE